MIYVGWFSSIVLHIGAFYQPSIIALNKQFGLSTFILIFLYIGIKLLKISHKKRKGFK